MNVVVQDANILIDLDRCGLLMAYLNLGQYTNHTTDLVLSELPEVLSDIVRSSPVKVRMYSTDQIYKLLDFKCKQPPGLTMADCSVFQHSLERGAVLLTGDSKLRTCAKDAGIEVHGTLWVLDQLIDAGFVEPSEMAKILEGLMLSNQRLPRVECHLRITAWRRLTA